MTDLQIYWLSIIVTFATWNTPMPQHAAGKLVVYGPQYLVEANAEWHGYDLAPYTDRCGVSAMSPADLGRVIWMRLPGGAWYGPCLTVDVSKRSQFAYVVYYVGELVEVARPQAKRFGFEYGAEGEVWVGLCPPDAESEAAPYAPPLEVDIYRPGKSYPMYPYPAQQWPVDCSNNIPKLPTVK